jgi:hypothetical protein
MSRTKSLASVADLIPARRMARRWDLLGRVRRYPAELGNNESADHADVVLETEDRADNHLVRCRPGQQVRPFGRATIVVLHPGTARRTTVTMHDGTGVVELVFTGPDRPEGLTAGVKLEVAGELTTYHGRVALINPRILAMI